MNLLTLDGNYDFQVDIGRADQGRTFVRVTHIPTGKQRIVAGIGSSVPGDVALKLANEITDELYEYRESEK